MAGERPKALPLNRTIAADSALQLIHQEIAIVEAPLCDGLAGCSESQARRTHGLTHSISILPSRRKAVVCGIHAFSYETLPRLVLDRWAGGTVRCAPVGIKG